MPVKIPSRALARAVVARSSRTRRAEIKKMINGEGLVGKVTQVASDGAQVSLITDSEIGISARLGNSSATGIVQPKVGEPNDLLLQYLPASAQATPMTYQLGPDRKQFVVIAAGGHAILRSKMGDHVVAFTLP